MKEKTMNSNICNHCGGEYGYRNGRYICFSCGSYKPEALSNEEVTLLCTAFQKLRLADFDEAEQEFDDILQKYPKNPNGYWGRMMSRYGIKYEQDFDGKMIPTCYATSIESVNNDKDYQQALRYADGESKIYYRQQAEYIERVRLEWVEKAKKEKPYDIFISYKDSDLAHGIERTKDSFAAQEIYIHLLEQGYRVFFSRESLRDKTGEKYEPYIFNALSTSKIMLVYGSSADYIKSTWVKNEWQRFAKKIADAEKHPKSLLVACEGFSPSELPHVLSSRQCFDASRRTFFGDLDKCIERIMEVSDKDTVVPKKEKTVISALHEHSYKKTVVKSTCVAKGYTLHQCECGEEYRDSYTPLAEHRYKVTNRIEPTCKKAGKVEESCEVCGQKQSKEIPALDHDFSKWTETKRPTCTENGEEQRQCQRCGEIEKKSVDKTGHSFGDWNADSDGVYTRYCRDCGAVQTQESALVQTDFMSEDVPSGAVYPIAKVFKNGLDYYKSYFTNQTTKAQKLMKLCGALFQIGWIIYAIGMVSVENSEFSDMLGMIAILIWIAGIIFGVYVRKLTKKEKIQLKNELRIFPKRVRLGFWALSRSMFLLAVMMLSDIGNDILSLYIAAFFAVWGVFSLFFAFTPRLYKKIGITKNISVSKWLFLILAIVVSVLLVNCSPQSM